MEGRTSIQDLPIEVLLYLFPLSFEVTSLRKDRCRLTLVCRYWRDIVQGSASLWTDISADDSAPYIQRSLEKSGDLPIDLYYGWSRAHSRLPRTYLPTFFYKPLPHLARWRSLSLITHETTWPKDFEPLFTELQSTPASNLESFTLEGYPKQRIGSGGNHTVLYFPGITAFPKLRRLKIDGHMCNLSSPGLVLSNVLSLNLVDVNNITAEELLDVLQSSPLLERLELGRSPATFPSQTSLTPIHLPRLTALHLIFMPSPVTNFFLSKIHAPNCSELFISSCFPQSPDNVVGDCLFTSSTAHFLPVLRTLLTRSLYKDMQITPSPSSAQTMDFLLRSHNGYGNSGHPGILRLQLDLTLNSPRQMEHNIRWLGDCFGENMPKIPIRLYTWGVEGAHLIDLIDSHMAITRLWYSAPPRYVATGPSPILVHMARPAESGWPLPDLEEFYYSVSDRCESQDEVMLEMLRCRYGSNDLTSKESPAEPSNDRTVLRPLRIVRIIQPMDPSSSLSREVRKILPRAEIFNEPNRYFCWSSWDTWS